VVSGFSGALVSDNTVVGARSDGILLRQTRASKLFNNDVTSCQGNGIHLDPIAFGNLVLENVASGNGLALLPIGGSGLLIESADNMIKGNLLNNNLGYGLQFCTPNASCNNTFGKNTARANQAAVVGPCGACAGAPALFPPNSCNVFCQAASPNSTFGDNLIPGPPVF
jgi:parallel beta-helix repeat protein